MLNSIKPREGREFRKSGCQLPQFPVIKLHIFTDIELLDLSDNLISNLSALQTHSATSPHVLARLRTVNLARNQFPNVHALLPLARMAHGITLLDISENPLVHTLNFLYELALGFEAVAAIRCGFEVQVDEGVRAAVVRQQLAGGGIIDEFLHAVERAVSRMRGGVLLQGEKELLEGLVVEVERPGTLIPQINDQIFKIMTRFTSFAPSTSSNSPTYRSPSGHASREIQVRSEYQVSSPNGLVRYLSQGEEQPVLLNFYYREMVGRMSIGVKVLQEIEVEEAEMVDIEEGRRTIPFGEMMQELGKKWTSNLSLTTQARPGLANSHCPSPFKSVQTDATAHHNFPASLGGEGMFFGFDREWTHETLQFLKHRLHSLVRTVVQFSPVQRQTRREKYQEELRTFQSHLSSPQQQILPSTFSSRDVNYQTFGPHSPTPFDSPSPSRTLLSPKSRNKFIIGSLVNVLELIVKRIVLRRIRSARFIQSFDVEYFQDALERIARRSQETAFRRIFEAALFYHCLQQKMDGFRKMVVFRAWRQVRRRKMRLLKTLLLRKGKKEKALLSVFLTQMRVNSSSIGLERKMIRSKAEMLSSNKEGPGSSSELQDVSCILRRSATCQKPNMFGRPKDSDRTIQAYRNYLKRSK